MRSLLVGVSLKTYFGHRRALGWFAEVADLVARDPAVRSGAIEFFLAPTYLQILPAMEAFAGTPALIAAQDVSAEEPGAFTGEVSAAELAEIGVRIAEIGHAERRRRYGETDAVVAAKTAAALRHGLVPLLCLGEQTAGDPARAGELCREQLASALADAPAGRVIVAYEPVWAIGAPEPAPVDHIRAVCGELRRALDGLPERAGSSVIYGGSAGPGLLRSLGGDADGLFLGRFAHDPDALAAVLREAGDLVA